MPAITTADLENAKLDVDHIAAIATSPLPTATDRLGNVKPTMTGLTGQLTDDLAAAAAVAATAAVTALALAVNDRTYPTKAALLADFDNIANDTRIVVLTDETKGDSVALYYKSYNAIEYVASFATTDEADAATGVFFDTATTDDFTDLLLSPHASLTIGANDIVFSSATAVSLDGSVPNSGGTAMKFAFDQMEVDMSLTLASFPANGSPGVVASMVNDTLGIYGAGINAHPAGTTTIIPYNYLTGAQRDNGASQAFTNPYPVRVRARREGGVFKAIFNFDGGADVTVTRNMTLTATSYETPRAFSTAGIRFRQADATITALKVSASYPNADFAIVGDSIAASRIATTYDNGWSALLLAERPGQVIIAGAPGATAQNWAANLEPVLLMKPKRALISLGVNDILTGRTLGQFQADYASIIDQLVAADIVPVIMSITPCNFGGIDPWNAWLAGLGYRYIDVFAALYDPSRGANKKMFTAYVNVDEVHPTDAGFVVMKNTVAAYLAAQSW